MTTGNVEAWLPPDFAAREAVRRKVDAALASWGERWFTKRRIQLSGFDAATAAKPDGAGWLVFREMVAVSCSKAATSRLTNWALDTRTDALEPTVADQDLLAAFRRRMLEDLLFAVETSLDITGAGARTLRGVKDPFGPTGGVLATVSDDRGSVLLQLAIPLRSVLSLCQASLPPRSRARQPLDSMRSAMSSIVVDVEASLGAAEIPLQDLRDLAPGDILVLDKAVGDLIGLSVKGSEEVVGQASLNDTDGRIALTLHA